MTPQGPKNIMYLKKHKEKYLPTNYRRHVKKGIHICGSSVIINNTKSYVLVILLSETNKLKKYPNTILNLNFTNTSTFS